MHVPPGVPPLVHRAAMTRDHGTYALDLLRSAWWCHRCRAHVASGPRAAAVPTVAYADVDSFVARVRRRFAGRALGRRGGAQVRDMRGSRAALDHIDYHAYCSAQRSDTRRAASRPSRPIELLWWTEAPGPGTEAGYRPATLDDDVRRAIARDARLRAAKVARDHGDIDRACEALEAAAVTMPGEAELIDFLPWLVGQGKTSVAGAIADAYAKARPRDPEGWYWLAQIGIELVAAGTWGHDMLPQIEQHLRAALAVAPTHAQSLVAVANVARVRGDMGAAIATLEQLLTMHPGHPEGSYTLGLLLLDADPAKALACFEAGERAQPNDADYPRGRARALMAMGRTVEARAAAARAQYLAPNDPRVTELVSRLAE